MEASRSDRPMSSELKALVQELELVESVEEFEHWKTSHAVSKHFIEGALDRVRDLLTISPKSALRLSEWTLSIALDLNDPFLKALGLRAKGNALVFVDDYFQALECFEDALKIFSEFGVELEIARTMNSRVVAYNKLSRFDEALADAEIVTEKFQELGDERRLAQHLVNIGHIYFRLDRVAEHLAMLDRAEVIFKKLDDSKSLCGVYINRAVQLTTLNKAAEAFKYYDLARRLAVEHEMPLVVAQCDYNICYLYFLQGQYATALEKLNTVRKHMVECGDRWHSALCNLDQAEIYLELNMHQDAIELAQQAYDSFQSLGMAYEMAKAVAFMGIAHNHLHNYGKALELFDRSRTMFRDQGNEVWLSLTDLYQGIVYFQTGRYYEGLDLAKKARDFFSRSDLKTKAIYAQLLVARHHLQLGNLDQAWNEVQSAAQAFGEAPTAWLAYQIQYVIGSVLGRQGDVHGARAALRKAVEELEILRTNIHVDELRMVFLKDKLTIYEALVRAALEIGDAQSLREAFEAVEHAKSRTLVDLLANNISAVHPNRDSDSELAENLKTIREELNWYYTRINLEEQKSPRGANAAVQDLIEEVHKREKQLMKLLRQVSSQRADYVTLQRVTTCSVEEIQEAIPEDAVMIEFYTVDDRVMAFAVTRDSFKVFPDVAFQSDVRTSFDLLRFQLTKFNLGHKYVQKFGETLLDATREHLNELYLELIMPIASALKGRRSIIFVPHGFMHYLPFHALFDGRRYLIDEYEISYAPSATIYRSCIPATANPTGKALVLGVPDVRAPQIEDEVRSIAGVFPNPDVFVGLEATTGRLREFAAKARVIHIASHGSFRKDNPMFSAIQLGDSWLSLFDIYNLRTSAELVTLSGCGTGMSKIVAGDELLGLVRGFLYSGARSLVVSLWDIHDETTAELMQDFYSSLSGGRSRWESLRSAVIAAKEMQPHPYYWAPFIGIGAP
jgi:CHAT domain-containing protein